MTQLELSNDAAEAAAQARLWLQAHWDPGMTVREWWLALADSGWGFPGWPVEWHGRGLSTEAAGAVRQVFLDLRILAPPSGGGARLAGPTILTHGSDAVKERFLGPIVRGEEEWCQYFSEPGAGSDLAGLQTSAVPADGGFRINGHKIWSSRAHVADLGMLLARTDKTVPKHNGITFFAISVQQDGIDTHPIHQMNGDASFNEVFFADAFVDDGAIVGEIDRGWEVALTTLMFERFVTTAAPAVTPGQRAGNLVRSAGDALAEGLSQLHHLGNAFGNSALSLLALAHELGRSGDASLRQQIAALYELENSVRFLTSRQAPAIHAGQGPGSLGSIRKLLRSRIAQATRDCGMAVLGAYGLLTGESMPAGGTFQHLALSAPRTSIAGGTDQIQRNIVSERLLGLPREPRQPNIPFSELRIGTQRRDDPQPSSESNQEESSNAHQS
jgi:alkylation response protein AidB-like acyl-CoA dehydrogenase